MEKSPVEITPAAALFYPVLYFFDIDGWFAALLPGVVLHELGHYWAIRACGGKVRRITLELAGLCMESEGIYGAAQEALCALAGPAAGFLWMLAALRFGGDWGGKSATAAALINGFNLLPALPLDGGRILRALTGSSSLVRASGLVTVFALAGLAVWRRAWGLMIPAGLLLKTALIAPE